MNNASERLMNAKYAAEAKIAENKEKAIKMVADISEYLVCQIEKQAQNGRTHLCATKEIPEKDILNYTVLMEKSTVLDGLESFKDLLRNFLEETGDLDVKQSVLGGIFITLTM